MSGCAEEDDDDCDGGDDEGCEVRRWQKTRSWKMTGGKGEGGAKLWLGRVEWLKLKGQQGERKNRRQRRLGRGKSLDEDRSSSSTPHQNILSAPKFEIVSTYHWCSGSSSVLLSSHHAPAVRPKGGGRENDQWEGSKGDVVLNPRW